MTTTSLEYDLLRKEISLVRESLAGSFEALTQRLARMENQKQPCCEEKVVIVMFTRIEAERLLTHLQSLLAYESQRRKLAEALDYDNL